MRLDPSGEVDDDTDRAEIAQLGGFLGQSSLITLAAE